MKKPEKKKSGKKKTDADDSPKFTSKALQRDFNKKMKALVRDVKKETQATIKNVLKEAKRKLSEGSELVMNDVLNSIVSTVASADAPVTGKKGPKANKAPVAPESNGEATATEAQTATRRTGPRKTKAAAPAVAQKPVVTRRRRAAEEAAPEAPASPDQE